MRTTNRIDRVLEPTYSDGLTDRTTDALRAMRDECQTIETSVSYYRRLAQARTEILQAERDRRARGASVEDLIAALPEILSTDRGRAGSATTRLTADTIVEMDWGGREALVADDTLANLPVLGDDELASAVAALEDFERELSERRQALHGVLDRIERELAERAARGA